MQTEKIRVVGSILFTGITTGFHIICVAFPLQFLPILSYSVSFCISSEAKRLT